MNKIKLIVFDVDGTLTDGKIYIGPSGEVMKAFCAHDAIGVRKLSNYGIVPIIITGRESNIVNIRAKEMNVDEVYQNVDDKLKKLSEIVSKKKINYDEIAYVGDDENDFECMDKCGFCACPSDAVDKIKEKCDYISKYKAGEGAVRDIVEFIIKE